MENIKIMVSSTVKDLEGERNAIKDLFKDVSIIEVVGADEFNNTSYSANSKMYTAKMARDCDLYILILGSRFGYELENGKSATEIEFDSAYMTDPTKILVFKKETGTEIDTKQQLFIEKVCDYYNGYWRTSFRYTYELQELVKNSFLTWLKDRACMMNDIDYLDHFIRIAKTMKPQNECNVYYERKKDDIKLNYYFFKADHIILFDKEEIYKNFWGCINELDKQIEEWLGDE